MNLSRGIVCEEIAGKPRHLRGYTGFLANMYYFSAPGNMSVWKKFSVRSVLDVGAAIGGWTVAGMHAWGWNIEAHLIEPNPETLCDLRWNIGHLSNVHVWPCAVSDVTGRAMLSLPDRGTGDPKNVGQLSIVQGGTPLYEVDVVKIDDLLPDFSPDFMKVDVEGAEPNVFLGAKKLLLRSKPVIFVETTRTFKAVDEILRGLGYEFAINAGRDHFFIHPDALRCSASWLSMVRRE